MPRVSLPALVSMSALLCLAGCAANDLGGRASREGDDPWKGTSGETLSRAGAWTLPADTRTAGEMQSGTYEDAPAWSSGRNCSGGLLPGTRALGELIVGTIAGGTRYEGYNCRYNTADTSRTSMHGTGRALDVYVPLSVGQADNDRGDPIANWLVENAEDIGVQFVIWDRTKWNISHDGRRDASYGGPHPHHDHIHIELSEAGARMESAYFVAMRDAGTMPAPAPMEPTAPDLGVEGCSDVCPYARDGECDDGGEGAAYALCALGTDCADCGARASGGTEEPPPRAIPVEEDPPAPATDTSCLDSCRYAGDGECDDGGPGAVYAVCALGTDCSDCGPRGSVAPSPYPMHAGIDLDGMHIPRAGLANETLRRTLGVSVEPFGDVVAHEGLSFVSGTVSWFGGPSDTGVTSTETGAVTGERLRALNDPLAPSESVLASSPEDYYFVAMRWDYAPLGVTWLRSARLLVVSPITGRAIVVRPVDWGPNTSTRRIVDLSPQSLTSLGIDTDDEVLISWAAPGTALGPVP